MQRRSTKRAALLAGFLSLVWLVSSVQAEESYELAARYILETVKAFRAAYVINVVEHVREGGILPNEEWVKNSHTIPLPAQFVKAAAADIEDFEIGLIGLTPIYRNNLPRTQAEADALMKMATDRTKRVVTFVDGKQFKAMSADVAVVQSCVDCHNGHPNSPWRNFKKGDVMGALVVRLNMQKK
ncbi:MAG: DUF3365 domain-containing protein [Nitrospirota bacterium]